MLGKAAKLIDDFKQFTILFKIMCAHINCLFVRL